MASIAKSQRRVTFKGDNVDTLMKPPCETLEYDQNAPVADLRKPVAKSPGQKLTRCKQAWVPRRVREKMTKAEPAEEKKTKPKKKVSFCDTAKKHDGMTPEREHYDQFMGRVVENGMPLPLPLHDRRKLGAPGPAARLPAKRAHRATEASPGRTSMETP